MKSAGAIWDSRPRSIVEKCAIHNGNFPRPTNLPRSSTTFEVSASKAAWISSLCTCSPSILGPDFREPNPLAWFRPTRASIPFEERGVGVNVRNLWHHARPRRATPYRRTVGATVLFSLRGYAGVWSLHIGAVPVSIL